jgi:hypothetical protein
MNVVGCLSFGVYTNNSSLVSINHSVMCYMFPLDISSPQEASGPVRWVCHPYRARGTRDEPSHEGGPLQEDDEC